MNTTTYRNITILVLITLLIFYPLFLTHFGYSDEILQLWLNHHGPSFTMFTPQGRFLTDVITIISFKSIHSIDELNWLRLVSLLGWIVCLPLWYGIFNRVCRKESLSGLLPFLSVCYLITSPPFCVSVFWTSCMELFLANTAGLVAGYMVYAALIDPGVSVRRRGIILAAGCVAGLISLFTYQSGYPCFLLPFLLHFLSSRRITRLLAAGLLAYLLLYVVYYLLFRWQLHVLGISPDARTSLNSNIIAKLYFFLTRPLAGAFHFTWLADYTGKIGVAVSALLLMGFMGWNLRKTPSSSFRQRVVFVAGILLFFLLLYIPGLMARENYASNRTMFSLDMGVFAFAAVTLLQAIKQEWSRRIWVIGATVFFVACACYNLRIQFLKPIRTEYETVRKEMEAHYQPGVTTGISFIRPPDDLFQRMYHTTPSWDEFGRPSTYPEWVPVYFVRQVILEKTGNLSAANSVPVQVLQPGSVIPVDMASGKKNVVIDVQKLLLNKNIF